MAEKLTILSKFEGSKQTQPKEKDKRKTNYPNTSSGFLRLHIFVFLTPIVSPSIGVCNTL